MTRERLDQLYQAWQQTNKMLRFGQFVVATVPERFAQPVPDIFFEVSPDIAYAKLERYFEL